MYKKFLHVDIFVFCVHEVELHWSVVITREQ